MNLRLPLLVVAFSVFLTGCATQQLAVPLAPSALTTSAGKIGVVMANLPKVDTVFPGADCLLCMAAASVANSGLTKYTQTLPYEDLPQIKDQLVEALRKKGSNVVVVPDNLVIADLPSYSATGTNIAKKDFSSLKAKYNIDKLIVIDIQAVGIQRNYATYIPVGEPMAAIVGASYVVNLTNNTYDFYAPLDVRKASTGKWDEPPKYPGLTNAYFQVLELTKDSLIKPLLN
jgi:hypothetical protein